jgi:mitochondrial import inner membrane translocase subunit TIM50
MAKSFQRQKPTEKAVQNELETPTTAEPPNLSALPSLDVSPPEPETTGARSRDGVSSAELQRRKYRKFMFALFGVGMAGHVIWMGREWESEELKDKRLVLLHCCPASH